MSVTAITSTAHFKNVLDSSIYVITDFYADWCGPCKAISPVFSQLASAETKPGRIVFVKVDVDAQQGIARQYGVSAMPTFLILKNGSVTKTIKGADPNGLRSAVLAASADAAKGSAKASASFQSRGHVLGGGDTPSKTQKGSIMEQGQQFLSGFLTGGLMDKIVRFVGLYLTTLLSLDPKTAAEASPFNVAKKGQ